MRVSNSYNPTLPIANASPVMPISSINPANFNYQRLDWWDVVSSQLGNRVVDMLKESFYGTSFQPSILKQPPTSDWLRVTLENEIKHAQEQQMLYTQEALEQDKQIKIAQIHAKSDAWLQEKAQKEAELAAELAALEKTQLPPEEAVSSTQTQVDADKNAHELISNQEKGEANKDKTDDTLSKDEQQLVNELASIDSEVRNHEAAHLGAAGGLAQGGASYTYTEGPDGKLYAVAGEVSIDTSSTGDPTKDLQKAKQIQAAAMAPSNPSPQDYRVAANVALMEMKAQMQLSEEFSEELKKEQGIKIYKNNLEDIQRAESAPMSFRIVA